MYSEVYRTGRPIKAVEYHNDFVEHLVPGSNFQWAGADPRNAELFFGFISR